MEDQMLKVLLFVYLWAPGISFSAVDYRYKWNEFVEYTIGWRIKPTLKEITRTNPQKFGEFQKKADEILKELMFRCRTEPDSLDQIGEIKVLVQEWSELYQNFLEKKLEYIRARKVKFYIELRPRPKNGEFPINTLVVDIESGFYDREGIRGEYCADRSSSKQDALEVGRQRTYFLFWRYVDGQLRNHKYNSKNFQRQVENLTEYLSLKKKYADYSNKRLKREVKKQLKVMGALLRFIKRRDFSIYSDSITELTDKNREYEYWVPRIEKKQTHHTFRVITWQVWLEKLEHYNKRLKKIAMDLSN